MPDQRSIDDAPARKMSLARQRSCAMACANFPHWWEVVIRCTPPTERAGQWEAMAREACQQAEYAGNPWFLADPLGLVMIDLPDLTEETP
jgi:hypothetical protein